MAVSSTHLSLTPPGEPRPKLGLVTPSAAVKARQLQAWGEPWVPSGVRGRIPTIWLLVAIDISYYGHRETTTELNRKLFALLQKVTF